VGKGTDRHRCCRRRHPSARRHRRAAAAVIEADGTLPLAVAGAAFTVAAAAASAPLPPSSAALARPAALRFLPPGSMAPPLRDTARNHGEEWATPGLYESPSRAPHPYGQLRHRERGGGSGGGEQVCKLREWRQPPIPTGSLIPDAGSDSLPTPTAMRTSGTPPREMPQRQFRGREPVGAAVRGDCVVAGDTRATVRGCHLRV